MVTFGEANYNFLPCCLKITLKRSTDPSNGGVVSITQRENDFFIKHGEMISQCPHEWFVIGGNLDVFNEPSSPDNQSCISLGMGNPETGLSLRSIFIDKNELVAIESDSVLSKYLDIGMLDKNDCLS